MSLLNILNQTLNNQNPHVAIPPKDNSSKMPWEEWVRNHLGDYLDILPYQNPVFSLEEYIIEMADKIANNIFEENNEKILFNDNFKKILSIHFQTEKTITDQDAKQLIQEYTNEKEVELRAICLVYLFHRKRKASLPEGNQVIWPIVDSSIQKEKVAVLSSENDFIIQQKEITQKRLNQRSIFLKNLQMLIYGYTRWDSDEMNKAFTILEKNWKNLDKYTQNDLQQLYSFIQQYKKPIYYFVSFHLSISHMKYSTFFTEQKSVFAIVCLAIFTTIALGLYSNAISNNIMAPNVANYSSLISLKIQTEENLAEYKGCISHLSVYDLEATEMIENLEKDADDLEKIAIFGGKKVIGDHMYSVHPLDTFKVDANKLGFGRQDPDQINVQQVFRMADQGTSKSLKAASARRIASDILKREIDNPTNIPIICKNEEKLANDLGCGIMLIQNIPASLCYISPGEPEVNDRLMKWFGKLKKFQETPLEWCSNYWNQTFPESFEAIQRHSAWRSNRKNFGVMECDSMFE